MYSEVFDTDQVRGILRELVFRADCQSRGHIFSLTPLDFILKIGEKAKPVLDNPRIIQDNDHKSQEELRKDVHDSISDEVDQKFKDKLAAQEKAHAEKLAAREKEYKEELRASYEKHENALSALWDPLKQPDDGVLCSSDGQPFIPLDFGGLHKIKTVASNDAALSQSIRNAEGMIKWLYERLDEWNKKLNDCLSRSRQAKPEPLWAVQRQNLSLPPTLEEFEKMFEPEAEQKNKKNDKHWVTLSPKPASHPNIVDEAALQSCRHFYANTGQTPILDAHFAAQARKELQEKVNDEARATLLEKIKTAAILVKHDALIERNREELARALSQAQTLGVSLPRSKKRIDESKTDLMLLVPYALMLGIPQKQIDKAVEGDR